MKAIRSLWFACWLGLAAGCPAENEAGRCPRCGMRVVERAWLAGFTSPRDGELVFDTPRCMFELLRSAPGRRATNVWVTEYYTTRRISAEAAHFVLGSDVRGPMGPELVPVGSRERAERFLGDHSGERVLTFSEVQSRILREHFAP